MGKVRGRESAEGLWLCKAGKRVAWVAYEVCKASVKDPRWELPSCHACKDPTGLHDYLL